MKRSELISWLFANEVSDKIPEDKNPKIIITDGIKDFKVLSVYSVDKKTICIDVSGYFPKD